METKEEIKKEEPKDLIESFVLEAFEIGYTPYQIKRVMTKVEKYKSKAKYHLNDRQEKCIYEQLVKYVSAKLLEEVKNTK